MYNVSMNLGHEGIKVIQVRIIELTNLKINLDTQIKEVAIKIDLAEKDNAIRELKREKRILIGRLIECEKILFLNKQLLNQTNEHEYQLEN